MIDKDSDDLVCRLLSHRVVYHIELETRHGVVVLGEKDTIAEAKELYDYVCANNEGEVRVIKSEVKEFDVTTAYVFPHPDKDVRDRDGS